MPDAIKIDGLKEFNRALRKMSKDLPKGLRLAGNEAAALVVRGAVAMMPRRSGAAIRSVKARSTRTAARVSEGSAKAPYVPWLDYGGKVGINRSVSRPFKKDGRYVYPSFNRQREEITTALEAALIKVARDAGVEVD